jgi:mono/diheme cytochrome c family protein
LFDGAVPELATNVTSAASRRFPFGVLPVDVAVTPDGDRMAIAMAGSRFVRVMRTDSLTREIDPCGFDESDMDLFPGAEEVGLPTGLTYTPFSSQLIVQYDNAFVVYRQPNEDPGNYYMVRLGGQDRHDVGRKIFHTATFSGLACASCHPEGREDGLVWTFGELGRRRTQNLGGGLLERAPYHWGGDMRDLHMLAEEVLVGRMGGNPLTEDEKEELTLWLGHIPAVTPSVAVDTAAVARGKAIFDDSETGCLTCHNGPLYTNNTMADVGTGGLFKVPSLLGVGTRAPYLHDGCAATLRERFGPCGGGDFHGSTSQLGAGQLDDLIAYLNSL